MKRILITLFLCIACAGITYLNLTEYVKTGAIISELSTQDQIFF